VPTGLRAHPSPGPPPLRRRRAPRKAENASARGLHRLKGLPLASAPGGRAWGVALGVSSVLEGYLEDWVRRAAFTVTLYR
jgi:hypothetical protein